MMVDLQKSVIRVLHAQGKTVGTGFVVSDHLAVTCAHVVIAANSNCDQPIHIQFNLNRSEQVAKVLTVGWSPPNVDDLAFLQLQNLPEGIEPVVLGTAEGRNRHSYEAFGFAHLANYDSHWVQDYLGGVVSIPDKHKRPMLQLKGNEIKGGLSGSPVLDTLTDRVVGMVSEYKDDERIRIAWATTVDTLVAYKPTLQVWPDAYGPYELEAYLDYLINTNQTLTLPDGNDVLLERIYVSLRADEMNAIERQAEHEIYLEDVAALQKLMEGSNTDQYTLFSVMRKVIAQHPEMLMLKARNWERLFGDREQGSLSLAEVVQRHPFTVLLGDPGSGKTTLGKWLVLQFANALRQGKSHVQVRADLVRPHIENKQTFDLGPTRLPIFIRIVDYARERWNREQGDTGLPLEKFLILPPNLKALPLELTPETIGAIAREYLKRGRALVVLDGLDEVSDPLQRRAVMQTVKKFLQDQSTLPMVSQWDSNRILLTSRIVGYQFQPLTHLPHYTIEDMDEVAIDAFCQAWMRYVTESNEVATEQARKLKDSIFDHAHPSVRTLAANPLLLTILAQVYWSRAEHSLPALRVDLFDEATKALYYQRKGFWTKARIRLEELTRALGAVAAYIHANEATGFAEESDVREQLRTILNPNQVERVLEAAREVSGFLVARGEGVYGFLHRSLQEYFAAKYLIDLPEKVSEYITKWQLNPNWREPISLAIGMVSQPSYPGSRHRLREIFTNILDAPDIVGDFLPRRELLATAACRECRRVPSSIAQLIARNLLMMHSKYIMKIETSVLCKSIQDAFVMLQNSPARNGAELFLCNTLKETAFTTRFAALDIIITTKWDSANIANALVASYTTYASPINSFVFALNEIFQRHPTYFRSDFLPLRQALEAKPHLWKKIESNWTWKRIISVLYLSESGGFSTKQINRDSPLTPLILAALQQPSVPSQLATLRKSLVSLINKPSTALCRDATVTLSILGNKNWVTEYIANVRDAMTQILPLILWHVFALDIDLNEIFDLIHEIKSEFTILLEYVEWKETDPEAILGMDIFTVFNIINALDQDLEYIDGTIEKLISERSPISDLFFNPNISIRELSIKLTTLAKYISEIRHFAKDLAGYRAPNKEIYKKSTAILELSRLVKNQIILLSHVAQALVFLIRDYHDIEQQTSETEQETSIKEFKEISTNTLPTLISYLNSPNDECRQHAQKILVTEHLASRLGKRVIEQLAEFTLIYADNPQISTHLDWALRAIKYDTPFWISEWMAQVKRSEWITPAEIILSHIKLLTSKTLQTILQELPYSTKHIKLALLRSIGWLARLGRIYDKKQVILAAEQLVIWLDQEADLQVCAAVIEVLGYWKDAPGIARDALLARLNSPKSVSELPTLYRAFSYLAAYKPNIDALIRPALLQANDQPEADAALVRLNLIKAKFETQTFLEMKQLKEREKISEVLQLISDELLPDESLDPLSLRDDRAWNDTLPQIDGLEAQEVISTKLLSLLDNSLSEPTRCLDALIEAGSDDNLWSNHYHGILVYAVRFHLEHNPELLPKLLSSLEHALLRKKWPARRFNLAAVAACIEVMPVAVQRASSGNLETMLVQGTKDANSSHSRRFALTALSYLRTVTSEVASALIAGCQDTKKVQGSAVESAARFQSIDKDPLPLLTSALTGESPSIAYAIAQVLGSLGVSTASNTLNLREHIIEALVEALKDPGSQREVFIGDENKGELENALYTALLQVTGWIG